MIVCPIKISGLSELYRKEAAGCCRSHFAPSLDGDECQTRGLTVWVEFQELLRFLNETPLVMVPKMGPM